MCRIISVTSFLWSKSVTPNLPNDPCVRACVHAPCMLRAPCVCACTVHAPCSVRVCMYRACSVLRACMHAPCMLRDPCVHAPCMHRVASCCKSFFHCVFYAASRFSMRHAASRFFTAFFTMQVVFSLRFLRCKSFFHRVFKLQGVFSVRILNCRAFFRCVFYTAGRFFVVYFTLQGVFSLCILHCRAFFVVYFVLCYVLTPYFDTFPEPKHTFCKPKHMFSKSQYACEFVESQSVCHPTRIGALRLG